MPDIYRATDDAHLSDPDEWPKYPHETMRAPLNVPYVVDNLWEWTRPSGYPSRRYAKFASPKPELAAASAGDGATPYRVAFEDDDFILCQLHPGPWTHKLPDGQDHRDARYHPDCRKLRKLVVRETLERQWYNSSLASKLDEGGGLFAPCLSAQEVEHLFRQVAQLREAREEIREAVTYWDDVRLVKTLDDPLDPIGEVYFAYPGGFRLKPIEAA